MSSLLRQPDLTQQTGRRSGKVAMEYVKMRIHLTSESPVGLYPASFQWAETSSVLPSAARVTATGTR